LTYRQYKLSQHAEQVTDPVSWLSWQTGSMVEIYTRLVLPQNSKSRQKAGLQWYKNTFHRKLRSNNKQDKGVYK
jgi:hypothetical protein